MLEMNNSQYFGNQAYQNRGLLQLITPTEPIYHQHLPNLLQHLIPNTHSLLLTQQIDNPKQMIQLSELLFDELNVQSLCLKQPQSLSLLSHGLTTGLVIDSGHNSSTVVVIFEGHIIHHSKNVIPKAGLQVEQNMITKLNQINHKNLLYQDYSIDIKTHIIQSIKHNLHSHIKTSKYTLPDKNIIHLNDSLLDAYQILFNDPIKYKTKNKPNNSSFTSSKFNRSYDYKTNRSNEFKISKSNEFKIINKSNESKYLPVNPSTNDTLQTSLFNSLENIDFDLKQQCLSNVVLTGGNLQNRILDQQILAINDMKQVDNQSDRSLQTFLGGQIVAQQPFYHQFCVTKSSYQEQGDRLILRYFQ